jgi:acetyl esterase/lipase
MNELSHKQARVLIQEKHLQTSESEALAEHLAHCAECREYAHVHLYLSRNLHLAAVRTRPAPQLRAAILRRASNQHRRNLIMTPVKAAAVLAAFAAVIFFAWSLIRSSSAELTAAAVPTSVPAAEPTEERKVEPTTAPVEEAPAPAEKIQALVVESSKNIAFTSDEGYPLLDVYAPSEPGPWPVVVLIPSPFDVGRESANSISNAIAAEGAVAYNATVFYDVPFSQAIEQTVCAVRFAQATAADFGGDPGSITLLGIAPGAAASAVVALAGDDFEGDCLHGDQSGLPNAAVLIEGPYDYITKGYSEIDHSFLADEDPELYEAINPYAHIGRNPDLKIRLIHGLDEDVAWSQMLPQVSIDFHQALEEAGYDATLSFVEGAHHSDIYTDSTSEIYKEVVKQTMEVANSS